MKVIIISGTKISNNNTSKKRGVNMFFTMKNIMGKCVLLLALAIVFMGLTACGESSPAGTSDKSGTQLEEGLLYPMYEKGSVQDRWGYIDNTGEYVIEPQFVYAGPFTEDGLAAAQESSTGLWGYIDTFGEWQISPEYNWADSFKDGIAKVAKETFDENGNMYYLYGYIFTSGEEFIPIQFYDIARRNKTEQFAGMVINGYAELASGKQSGKWWGSFDADTYNDIDESDLFEMTDEERLWYSDYTEGPVYLIDNEKQAVGFVNEDGKYVIKPDEKYKMITGIPYFSEGMCPVYDNSPGVEGSDEYSGAIFGFMNEKGKMCTEMSYYRGYTDPSPEYHNGVALVRTLPNDDGFVDYGYIDKKGNWVYKNQYNSKLDHSDY